MIKCSEKENFIIQTNQGCFETPHLVIATGGVSYPQIGASDLGYKIAKQFGLKVIPYKPALVPFNIDSEIMRDVNNLRGISLNVEIKCNKFSIKESLLLIAVYLQPTGILIIATNKRYCNCCIA